MITWTFHSIGDGNATHLTSNDEDARKVKEMLERYDFQVFPGDGFELYTNLNCIKFVVKKDIKPEDLQPKAEQKMEQPSEPCELEAVAV